MDEKKTEQYEAPAITDIASVHELTLATRKHKKKTPDGYYLGHHILTS